jgi:hypothetical protein
VRFVVNVPALIELMLADADEDDRKVAAALGVQTMRSVVGHMDYAGEEGLDSRLEAMLLLSSERTGLTRILAMPNREVAAPPLLSSDTAMYFYVHLSPLELIDEIERIVRQTDPDAADQMHAAMEEMPTPSGESINFRREILENLRGPVGLSFGFTKPYTPKSVSLAFTVGHRNREAIERVLARIAGAGGGMTSRDVAGSQVFDVAGVSFTATADSLLIGTTPTIEAMLSGRPSNPLGEDARFRESCKHVAREAWGVCYVDSRRMLEAALAFAKQRDELQGMFGDPAAMIAYQIAEGFAGELDRDKLEHADKLLKYQSVGMATLTTTPDGILLTSVELRPQPK